MTKIGERRWNAQVHDLSWEQGEVLVMFAWYDNLCCFFLIEFDKVIFTPPLYICQSLVRSEVEMIRCGELLE